MAVRWTEAEDFYLSACMKRFATDEEAAADASAVTGRSKRACVERIASLREIPLPATRDVPGQTGGWKTMIAIEPALVRMARATQTLQR